MYYGVIVLEWVLIFEEDEIVMMQTFLIFSTLLAKSADSRLIFFPRKQGMTFYANCLLRRQFA